MSYSNDVASVAPPVERLYKQLVTPKLTHDDPRIQYEPPSLVLSPQVHMRLHHSIGDGKNGEGSQRTEMTWLSGVTTLGDPYHSLPRTDTCSDGFLYPPLCHPSRLRAMFQVESELEGDRGLIVPETVEHHGAVEHPELR